MSSPHCCDLDPKPLIPRTVEPLVCEPGRLHIDRHGPVLDATDILLDSVHFPWNRKTIPEKCSWDGGAQKDTKVWHKVAQRIEHRHDLRRVTKSMS